MEEKLAKLQAKIEADKSLGEKLFSKENPQDVQQLLKEQGIEFSLDEIEVLKNALVKISEKGSDELSDEDLENVAGGSLTVMAIVAIVGAIAGAVTAAGGVVDNAVRSRW
ncbi:MAG: Nif11-like leader peptide family RiPP precursor [Syntrophomonadaceae bacterium]|nr:Nif11-like leader peptide family RiPP precursor [Syntrophomonadaceae bacterium]